MLTARRRFGPALAVGTVACVLLMSSNVAFSQTTQPCGHTSWTLWAGQTLDVGSVTVSNDLNNLYVTYTLDYQDPDCLDGDGNPTAAVEAVFGALHLWVGETDPTGPLSTMPATGKGIPIPGKFPYKVELDPEDGVQTYTFTIPFSELDITNATTACDKTLYVVAHAEVEYLDCEGNLTGGGDTAFGGDNGINIDDPGRWWYYGAYEVCCEFGPPIVVEFCKTAYAKGGYVWTTDKRSNPENLPSLNLTKNRWGWAIRLTEPGETTYEIWAGAGLNKTSNGVKVGTLTVIWDGEYVDFCYKLDDGFTMKELHVYAGDDSPTTIAPGRYGYIQDFNDEPVDIWTDSVPAADVNGGGVWVVAHAVVCFGN